MNGTTLDTLELFEDFKQSFTEEQAQKLSKALKRVEESRLEALATKKDLAELELRLIKWVAGLMFVQTGLVIGALFAIIRVIVPG